MLTFDGVWHFGEVFSSQMNPGFHCTGQMADSVYHPGGYCILVVVEEIPPFYVKRFEYSEKRYINVTNYYYYIGENEEKEKVQFKKEPLIISHGPN